MRYIELQEAFETELNVVNDGLKKPLSIDTEYFLNAGLGKFVGTLYNAFEQNQVITDSLRTLVTEKNYQDFEIASNAPDKFAVLLPTDYVYLLGDTVGIAPSDDKCISNWPTECINGELEYQLRYSDTLEGTIDTIDRIRENSLSEYHLHYGKARPIRLIAGEQIKLYTDGNYKIGAYSIQYLRQPKSINIHANPFAEYTDMPGHTHLEIVKMAAQLYMENQANERFQTFGIDPNVMG